MRVAILSDIHGNTVALEAVLRELKVASSDRLVCLGNVGANGPEPSSVLALYGGKTSSVEAAGRLAVVVAQESVLFCNLKPQRNYSGLYVSLRS